MMKSSLMLFKLMFLTTIMAWAQDGVKVTHNIPSSVKQGSEFTVDVFLEKKGIEGFSKLQFALPVGLSASSVESNGATFSFKDQLVNFVWMSLPELESFKISYKVNVSSTVFGEDSVTGNFNYMHSNEKQTYKIPTSIIDIQLAGSKSATVAAAPVVSAANEPIKAVSQTIIDTTKKITEEIKKEELSKEIETQNPTAEANTSSKTEPIETPKPEPVAAPAVIPSSVETVKPSEVEKPVAIAKPIEPTKPAEAPKPVVAVKPSEPSKAIEKPKPVEVKIEKPAPKATGIPAQPGLIFKVQVAALGSQPKADAFAALSDISNFKSPEGLNKYFSGNFKTYDDASKHLVNVKAKGFEQAFIAAFKNGAPISVKEALGK